MPPSCLCTSSISPSSFNQTALLVGVKLEMPIDVVDFLGLSTSTNDVDASLFLLPRMAVLARADSIYLPMVSRSECRTAPSFRSRVFQNSAYNK